jgi:hypothetical protein
MKNSDHETPSRGFKLQSAMEYLMTYGWALLIMALVLSVMFTLGIFNPGQFAGQECLLPAGFSCLNFYMFTNSTLVINLEQATQSPINVTAYNCTTNSTSIRMIPLATGSQVYMPIGSNATISMKCYAATGGLYSAQTGTLFTGSIGINYTEIVTGFPHTAYGKVAVKVS